jgi:hypothetical protein|tara:strand:+ start:108 stop:254 length:147 start_codon:yes stop_codon:yes gene_type:complete
MAVEALLAQKGLYLLVHPNGPKYWWTDDRFLGKRKPRHLVFIPTSRWP